MPPLRLLVPLLALLVACDAGTPATSPAPGGIGAGTGAPEVSAVIDAAQGGLVADPDGASVSVPADAVPKDVRISLRSVPAPQGPADGARVVGKVWSFKVDGADRFQFSKAVRLAVPYDPSQASADAPVGLSVWQDGRWEPVPGARAEPDARRVVAEVDHFSDYAPTQDEGPGSKSPGKQPGPRDARPRPFDNEYYYGTVRVAISGGGHRGGDSPRSFSISRQAEVKFRVQASPGAAASDAILEEMTKRGFQLPPEALEGLEKSRQLRHWTTALVNQGPEDETEHRLSVNDRYDATDPDWGEGGRLGPDTVTHRTLSGGNSGKSATMHQLVIDLGKKTYSFGGTVPAGELHLIETVTGEPNKEEKAPAFVTWQFSDRKLPADGGVLSETLPIPSAHLDRHISQLGHWGGYDFGSLSGTITWTLSPVPFEDVELVLAPQGWDDWLPRGGPNEQTKGNSIRVKASLRRRGGGSTKARLKKLVVELDDVSRVPGVCLNRPLQGGATTPDLQFAAGPGLTIEDEGTRLTKEGEHSEVTFEVDCYDWGAWGAVVAHGTTTDGRPVWATLDGDPSQAEVRLPKRATSSKVADRWKTDMGAAELADGADDEKQEGNQSLGDGLDLYEEYRGLVAKGKHTRDHQPGPGGKKPLSPAQKDLAVHVAFKGGVGVAKGLRLLETAAHVGVVELSDGELPESRRVVVNPREGREARQHGLRLFDERLPDGSLGNTEGASGGSPVKYPRVVVDLQAGKRNYDADQAACRAMNTQLSYTLEEWNAATVAHELAHGLGVAHHGPDESVPLQLRTLEATSTLEVWDRAGRLITRRPFQVEGDVGRKGNVSSGDPSCVMCYPASYAWAYHDGLRLMAVPLPGKQASFCRNGQGKAHNAPRTGADGGAIPGVFGDAQAGNCLGQMRVRDP